MKKEDIRALSSDEIRARIEDTREEYMNLRFQLAMGGLTDYTRLRFTRRAIARLLTVLRERELAANTEGAE